MAEGRTHTDGLLEQLTRTSLDEDYAAVATRRTASASVEEGSRRRRRTLAMVAVLACFGLLLATAAVHTARTAAERDSSRTSLVAQVAAHRANAARTRAELAALRTTVQQQQLEFLRTSDSARAQRLAVRRLAVAAGAEAVTGPGVRVVVDDAPTASTDREVVLDEDLQRLVNGLWVAGAEAVAINGQRLTNLTAIREAGSAITVNFTSLRRPYVVEAVGDPQQLPARFVESDGGSWWLNLRSVYGVQFTLTSEESLTVPAVPLPRLRHADRPGGRR